MYGYDPYMNPYYTYPHVYNPYNYYTPAWSPQLFPTNPHHYVELIDYGPDPFVINIEETTKQNTNFRTALWTGKHLQLTLMSLNAGEDIGLEMHPNVDQFIRIEEGQGLVVMGDTRDRLDFQRRVFDDYIIIVPAGKWHNVINTGNTPLKLYSIYAPPEHPHGTVHRTKMDAEKQHRR